MFRSLFRGFTHVGSVFPGRPVTRVATLAALTVLTLGTLASTSVAQDIFDGQWYAQPATVSNTTPLRAYFTKLVCLDETDDGTFSNSDEPYVVIFVADLRGSNSVSKVFFSQTFSDVDKDETRSDMLQIWALNGTGQPIGSDNDYIMLAALMESDNEWNRSDMERLLPPRLARAAAAYKASGMSRSAMARALKTDMDLALEATRSGRRPYPDDRVGEVFEIIWGTDRLSAARSGYAMNWSGLIVGSDSKYLLEFRLQ